MEVVDPQPARYLDAECFLEPVHQLRRGLDVVGQDEDVLRLERRIRREQMADTLDDHGRLARARTGKDHQRSSAPFDRGSLFFS